MEIQKRVGQQQYLLNYMIKFTKKQTNKSKLNLIKQTRKEHFEL